MTQPHAVWLAAGPTVRALTVSGSAVKPPPNSQLMSSPVTPRCDDRAARSALCGPPPKTPESRRADRTMWPVQQCRSRVRANGALLGGRVPEGVVVCAGELGADLAGVGMVQVLEDGERLLPGLPGLGRLAGGVAGVAEAGEGVRFKDARAGFLYRLSARW